MEQQLNRQRQALDELWARGLSGASLLRQHSRLADRFIADCFTGFADGQMISQVAVVALGGYGREELFPFSDIDLMILFRPAVRDRIAGLADAILYPLWDTGYEIGHGVRTVEESLQQAGDDFIFRVALLDARLLAGSEEVFGELTEAYQHDFVDGRRHDFIRNLNRFNDERRSRFGSHGYLLEPNIKESKGGLRDVQSLLWAAKVVFGITSFAGIVDAGFLLQSEAERFLAAYDMLVRIRNRLHYLSGRKNDQLYFEQQEAMADAFGYQADQVKVSVERFMRDVYGHLRVVTVFSDRFFDHVGEVLGLDDRHDGPADRVVEKGIEIRGKRVHLVARDAELAGKPHLLMRVFLAAARFGVPLHHRSKMTITRHLGLITPKLRGSPRMARPFLTILSTPDALPILEVMLDTGLLGMYLPEFARIDSLAQHDVYHIYTVDHHSLQALDELHRVVEEQPDIAALIGCRSPFYLAALLHDIGKNSGRDHSEYGAELAATIGGRLGLSDKEIDLLVFLVRYHLFIPENALRRDLEDRNFIKRCAETIRDGERLAMLYLLSVADSRATGPSAWSDWKATLMHDLYRKVATYLAHSDEEIDVTAMVDQQYEEGVVWLRQQVDQLAAAETGLQMAVGDLAADYLCSFTPGTVLSHLCLHRDRYQIIRQKSLLLAEEAGDHWSVLVMSFDQPGLLAKICGVMTLNNLSVVNAQIFTWPDGTVVDMIDVRPTDDFTFAECDWQDINRQLDLAVNHRLGLSGRLSKKLSTTTGRRLELAGSHEYRVEVENESSDDFTIVEVHAADLPGQLYRITQTLADLGINIHKAFIATEVGQLIDVFYVLDKRGHRIEDPQRRESLSDTVLQALGRP
ncbi:MAG: [protein-PII] uridylyltransferase [Desulfobulbaceae bacterium]|nr:[protein-PII] uridylyltransferase [Desulfobulbaceae bacterium]